MQDYRPPQTRQYFEQHPNPEMAMRVAGVEESYQRTLGSTESKGYSNWFGALGEVYLNDTITGDLAKWATGAWIDNEDNFTVTTALLQDWARDIPKEYWDDLRSAKSRHELIYRADNIKNYLEYHEELDATTGGSAAFWTGVITDPVFLLASLATAGVGGYALGAAKVAKAGRALSVSQKAKSLSTRVSRYQGAKRGALIGAVVDGGLETSRAAMSDVFGYDDALFAATLSAGAGALIGARWPQVTMPTKVNQEYTEKLYRERFNALMETMEGTPQELSVLARAYANSGGKLGYTKTGAKSLHTDPWDVSRIMGNKQANVAVAGGIAEKTVKGLREVPDENGRRLERGAALTPKEHEARIKALEEANAEAKKSLNNATQKELEYLEKSSIGQLKQIADDLGLDIDVVERGSASELRAAIRQAQRETMSGVGVTRSDTMGPLRKNVANTQKDLNAARADYAADDYSRHADKNTREWSGQALDDIVEHSETYDPSKESRNPIQMMVDMVNNAPLLGTAAGTFLNHASEKVRRLGTLLADDGFMRNNYSLLREANRVWGLNVTNFRHNMAPMVRAVIKEMGIEGTRRHATTKAHKMILDAVRSGETYEGAMGEAVGYWRAQLNKERQFAAEFGLHHTDFDNAYVPRVWNKVAMIQLLDAEPEVLKRILKGSFKSGSNITDEETLDMIVDRAIRAGTEEGYVTGRMTNTKAWAKFKDKAHADLVKTGRMDEDSFEEFMDLIAPIRNKKSIVKGGSARLKFDETYVDPETGLGFTDLLVNDMDSLYQSTVKRNRGAGYWQKVVDDVLDEGDILPSYRIDDVIGWLEDKVRKEGGDLNSNEWKKVKMGLQSHYRSMMGLPQGDSAFVSKVSRTAMDYSHHVYMNDAGWANSVEFLNTILLNRLTSIESMFGGLISVIRRPIEAFKYGGAEFSSPVLAELEAAVTPFSGLYTRFVQYRLDESMDFMGAIADSKQLSEKGIRNSLAKKNPFTRQGRMHMGIWGERINTFLRMGTHLNPFGIGPIDHICRMATLESSYQRFLNTCMKIDKKGGVGVFKEGHNWWAKDRLNELGLSDEDITKIIKILQTPGIIQTKTNYRFKTKYLAPNFDDWQDEALVMRFGAALSRELDRNIQRTSVSNLSWWANHPVGRAVVQFRSFALGALTQQLGYNLRRGDAVSFAVLTMSLLPRMFTYYLQTLGKTVGMDPDKAKEFVDERLTPERVVSMGVAGSGPWGLMGAPLDMVGPLMFKDYPRDGLFQYGAASTGVVSGIVDGVPTYSLIKAWEDIGGDIYDGAADRNMDDVMTQDYLRKIKRVLPWQNMFGPSNLMEMGIEATGLPNK